MNFGEVCVRSGCDRQLDIVNNLDQFVHVVIQVIKSVVFIRSSGGSYIALVTSIQLLTTSLSRDDFRQIAYKRVRLIPNSIICH